MDDSGLSLGSSEDERCTEDDPSTTEESKSGSEGNNFPICIDENSIQRNDQCLQENKGTEDSTAIASGSTMKDTTRKVPESCDRKRSSEENLMIYKEHSLNSPSNLSEISTEAKFGSSPSDNMSSGDERMDDVECTSTMHESMDVSESGNRISESPPTCFENKPTSTSTIPLTVINLNSKSQTTSCVNKLQEYFNLIISLNDPNSSRRNISSTTAMKRPISEIAHYKSWDTDELTSTSNKAIVAPKRTKTIYNTSEDGKSHASSGGDATGGSDDDWHRRKDLSVRRKTRPGTSSTSNSNLLPTTCSTSSIPNDPRKDRSTYLRHPTSVETNPHRDDDWARPGTSGRNDDWDRPGTSGINDDWDRPGTSGKNDDWARPGTSGRTDGLARPGTSCRTVSWTRPGTSGKNDDWVRPGTSGKNDDRAMPGISGKNDNAIRSAYELPRPDTESLLKEVQRFFKLNRAEDSENLSWEERKSRISSSTYISDEFARLHGLLTYEDFVKMYRIDDNSTFYIKNKRRKREMCETLMQRKISDQTYIKFFEQLYFPAENMEDDFAHSRMRNSPGRKIRIQARRIIEEIGWNIAYDIYQIVKKGGTFIGILWCLKISSTSEEEDVDHRQESPSTSQDPNPFLLAYRNPEPSLLQNESSNINSPSSNEEKEMKHDESMSEESHPK